MWIERVAVDASPLICLAKADLLDLLPKLFACIAVPAPVHQEILAKGENNPIASAIPLEWVVPLGKYDVPDIIRSWDIGAGESSVLTFALKAEDYWAVIDDREARRCASSIGCRYIGSVGIILLAKKRGIISSDPACLDKLQNAGLWMSKAFMEQILIKFAD